MPRVSFEGSGRGGQVEPRHKRRNQVSILNMLSILSGTPLCHLNSLQPRPFLESSSPRHPNYYRVRAPVRLTIDFSPPCRLQRIVDGVWATT